MTPRECPAYILAGGRSSRFGSDKALVEVAGQPLLLRLQQKLAATGHSVRAIADRPSRYADLRISCLVDVVQDRGPLAGLASALQHRLQEYGPGWLLLVSCDQLFWQLAWFEQLVDRVTYESNAVTFCREDACQVVFRQPIPGLYHTQLLSLVNLQLERGHNSLQSLLDSTSSVLVFSHDNPADWTFNTQLELDGLLSRCRPSGDEAGRRKQASPQSER